MSSNRTANGQSHFLFLSFVVVCLLSAVAFIALRRGRTDMATQASHAVGGGAAAGANAQTAAAVTLDEIRARPHLYYRSYRSDEYGRVVVAALDAPNDRRVVTSLDCERVDFGVHRGICLVAQPEVVGAPAVARIYDTNFNELASLPLAGIPIRTRLSPDERYAAATVFVTGERYDADFTTRTTIIDTETMKVLGDLEQFEARRDGRRFSRIDFNYWGVTFSRDASQFYATLGYTGTRFLVRGDVAARQLTVVRDQVECPSLSPDDRLVAFKSKLPETREWRPHVIDLASGREWAVAGETRNIDDQIEWLDAGHILYQFTADIGLPEQAVNVWMSPVAPDVSAAPQLFIRAASSPAVVRP